MNETIAFKAPIDVINPDLDKYNDINSFPEKTRKARENLAKYGLPKAIQERLDKIEREKSFWVRGTLYQVDASTNSFTIVGKASGINPVIPYHITTQSSEELTKLVKKYWNETHLVGSRVGGCFSPVW